MISIRKSGDRGAVNLGWLESRHTFSFGEYRDPHHMGFRTLRVINEDRVQPGQGFGTHGHRDMEIISYIVEGTLAHKDSMGNGSVLTTGDVQRMTAGTGVQHSEMNPSVEESVHFLQIWILPEAKGLQPGYEERHFPTEEKRGALRLICSRDGGQDAISVHQDVALYGAILEPGKSLDHSLDPGRHAWVQVLRGELTLNGQILYQGDGAAVSEETGLSLRATGPNEVIVFDLA
ncbi:MAG: pirin family protein [Gemmatimonadetes bacterium]|nr:pirin family protein [Gemmatimonadota bacterium]